MKTNTLFAAFFLLAFSSSAQSFNAAKLDSLFDLLAQHDRFMGSVSVAHNGTQLYTRAIGKADIATGVSTTENTKYRIGSVSKTFTAVLIFQAIEAKKITLEQTIDRYFPTLPNGKTITVAHLLGHRSGLYDFTNAPDYFNWNTQAKSREEMVAIISGGKMAFKPGKKGSYCNSNYVLLSYILEDLYGKPYAEILNEHITDPLVLKDTYVGKAINLNVNEAYSYRFGTGWQQEPETHPSICLGAGAIVSTPSDLNRFMDAIYGGKLVSPNSLTQMSTIKDGYGMGLFQISMFGLQAFGHDGSIDGFSSVTMHFPTENLSVAIVSNGKTYPLGKISQAIVAAYLNQAFELPEFYSVSEAELDQYVGKYASTNPPVTFIVTKNGGQLLMQVEGQSAAAVTPVSKDVFEQAAYRVRFEFNLSEKSMTVIQGKQQQVFTRTE